MTLALAVWACTLPFVFLLIVPWLGARAAVFTALALLAGITVVCWALCACDRAAHGTSMPGGDGTPVPPDAPSRSIRGSAQ